MTEDPRPNPEMLELAKMVLAFDRPRVQVMVDLLRTTIINARAPTAEVLWALVTVLVALVRASHDRPDWLDTVQKMIGLAMEMAARQDAKNIH